MSNKIYKNFTVYSAPLKKNVGYCARYDDFKNIEDLNKYIQTVKDKHKKENYEHKIKMKQQKYGIIGNTIVKEEVKEEIKKEIVEIPKKRDFENVKIENDINLHLQNNTGNSTCLFGSSKRGKSTLMMHLYKKYYAKDKDFICTLFSINSHINVYKADKKLLRCGVFNKSCEKFIKLEKYINSKTNNEYKFLNMLDDCINTKYSNLMNECILTYRNSNMSTMICLQYGYLLSKMNRANCNNIIIFGANSHESQIDLINVFLKPFFMRMGIVDLGDQLAFFKYITDNHGFFYIDNMNDIISFHRLNLKKI